MRTEWWAHLRARSGQRAPPVTLLTSCLTLSVPWPLQILWTFSIYLESVAILPQLFMVSKTGEAETITSHYLFALGVYRTLYLFNWIWRYHFEGFFDLIAIVAGLVQTVLYCDFFYLYITKGNQDAGLAERSALFPVLYFLGPGSFCSQISPGDGASFPSFWGSRPTIPYLDSRPRLPRARVLTPRLYVYKWRSAKQGF